MHRARASAPVRPATRSTAPTSRASLPRAELQQFSRALVALESVQIEYPPQPMQKADRVAPALDGLSLR
eukprot:m.125532 g.125532  ORF g.125532 m.125532 type:complete len:69 (+) comp52211_c0_seq4:202-408(+)